MRYRNDMQNKKKSLTYIQTHALARRPQSFLLYTYYYHYCFATSAVNFVRTTPRLHDNIVPVSKWLYTYSKKPDWQWRHIYIYMYIRVLYTEYIMYIYYCIQYRYMSIFSHLVMDNVKLHDRGIVSFCTWMVKYDI